MLDFWAVLWYIFHDSCTKMIWLLCDMKTVNRGLRFLPRRREQVPGRRCAVFPPVSAFSLFFETSRALNFADGGCL